MKQFGSGSLIGSWRSHELWNAGLEFAILDEDYLLEPAIIDR